MYKIYKLGENTYSLYESGIKLITGTQTAIKVYSADQGLISTDEIDLAFDWLDEYDHNMADFGFRGIVTFTSNVNIDDLELIA